MNKELEKSIRICDNILEKYEKFLDAIYLKALILYESKKFKDSKFYIEEYKKVLKDKKEFEVYGVEMFSESSFNNIEKILNKINDVLLFDKLLFNMKENIVELIKKNDINVLKFIEEIKKSGVYFEINDSEFYNILGVAYYNFGFLEEALKEIDNGLIKFENDFNLNFNKGELLASLERYNEAIIYYKKSFGVSNKDEDRKIIEQIILDLEGK